MAEQAVDCEGFCLRSNAHLQEGHAACPPSQMPEMPSMRSNALPQIGGVGHCQGVVPGLCLLELPVTQAAQPHMRVPKFCSANLYAGCSSCSSSCSVFLQVCVGTSATDVPLTACTHQQQRRHLPPRV